MGRQRPSYMKSAARDRKDTAVKRRKARRPASWAGRFLPLEERPDRKAGPGVRRSAPAPAGASPPRALAGLLRPIYKMISL